MHQKQKSKHVAITSVRSKVRPLARSVERVLQQMRSSARIVDRRLYRNSQLRNVTPQPVKDEEVEVIPPEAAPATEETAQPQQEKPQEGASVSTDIPVQESGQQTGSNGFGSAETSDAFTVK